MLISLAILVGFFSSLGLLILFEYDVIKYVSKISKKPKRSWEDMVELIHIGSVALIMCVIGGQWIYWIMEFFDNSELPLFVIIIAFCTMGAFVYEVLYRILKTKKKNLTNS